MIDTTTVPKVYQIAFLQDKFAQAVSNKSLMQIEEFEKDND